MTWFLTVRIRAVVTLALKKIATYCFTLAINWFFCANFTSCFLQQIEQYRQGVEPRFSQEIRQTPRTLAQLSPRSIPV